MIRTSDALSSGLLLASKAQTARAGLRGKPSTPPPAEKPAPGSPEALRQAIEAKAKEEADAAAARIRDALDEGRKAGDGLRQSLNAGRKAMAGETVERLKKQVADLAKLAAVNPKGVARMVRLLSRQLAKAMADYADAAGSDAEMARTAREAEAVKAEAERKEVAAKADATPDKPVEGKDKTSTATAGPEAKAGAENGGAEEGKSNPAAPASAVDPAEQAKAQRDKVRAAYLTAGAAIGGGTGEEKFLRDVEAVRRALETLIRRTLASLEDERERKDMGDAVAQDLAEVDDAVAAIRQIRTDFARDAVSAAFAEVVV